MNHKGPPRSMAEHLTPDQKVIRSNRVVVIHSLAPSPKPTFSLFFFFHCGLRIAINRLNLSLPIDLFYLYHPQVAVFPPEQGPPSLTAEHLTPV
jgi:hypothetical protein